MNKKKTDMLNKINQQIKTVVIRAAFALLLLIMSVSVFGHVNAVQYNSTASSTWCNSTLQQSLNNNSSSGYLQTALGADYATWVKKLDTCTTYPTYMRLIKTDEWTGDAGKDSSGVDVTGAQAYKEGINSGSATYSNYLPNDANAWTMSADGNNLYYINYSTGDVTSSTAATSDLDAYPVIELNCTGNECGNLCITNGADGLGSADNPFTLTTSCNNDPTVAVNNSNLVLNLNDGATFTGTYSDGDSNQQITITITLTDEDGATITKQVTGLDSYATNAAWNLKFNYADVLAAGLKAGKYTATQKEGYAGTVKITISDDNLYSSKTRSTNYTGDFIIDWTAPKCTSATNTTPWQVNSVNYSNNAENTTLATEGVSLLPWNMGDSFTATLTMNGSEDATGSGIAAASMSQNCTVSGSHGSSCTLVVSDLAGNTVTCRSPFNRVDITPPTPVCGIKNNANTTNNVYIPTQGGSVAYYNAHTTEGYFDIEAHMSSDVSNLPPGLAQASFSDLDNDGSANSIWDRNPTTISANTDADIFTSTYHWNGNSTIDGVPTVTLYSHSGQPATCNNLNVYADAQGPTGFSLDYAEKYINSTSDNFSLNLMLNRTNATDDRSGIDENSFLVYRYVGTLTGDSNGNTCNYPSQNPVLVKTIGASSNVTNITIDDIRDVSEGDNTYASGHCFKYELRVSDMVGNQRSFAATNSIKIDLDQPTCGLWSVSGLDGTFASNNTSVISSDNPGASVLPWNTGENYVATLVLTDANEIGGSGLNPATNNQSADIAGDHDEYADITIADKAGNTTVCRSPLNRVDSTDYKLACRIADLAGQSYTSDVSGVTYHNYYKSGKTVLYYNPYNADTPGSSTYFTTSTGTFTLEATSSGLPDSGIRKVAFPALAGTAAQDVTSPVDASTPRYYAKGYAWTSSDALSVTDANVIVYYGNNEDNRCAVTVKADHTAPTGVAPGYADQYTNTTTEKTYSLAANTSQFADSGAGIQTFTIQRRQGTLSAGTCDYTGSQFVTPAQNSNWVRNFSTMSGNISVVDTLTATNEQGYCYQYQFVVTDRVGNEAKFPASNSIKVSLTDPSNNITNISSAKNLYWDQASTVYYSDNTSVNSFEVTVEAIDPSGNMSHVDFQNLAKNGYDTESTQSSRSHYAHTYALPTNQLTVNGVTINAVTSSSHTSATSFNLVYDGEGPTGVAFNTCPTSVSAYQDSTSFTVEGSFGSDALSHVDNSRTYIERAVGHLYGVDGHCYYDSDVSGHAITADDAHYTKISGTGGEKQVNSYIQSANDGACYSYRLVSEDNVGNVTRSNVCEVAIDRTEPVCGATPDDWEPVSVYPWNTNQTQAFRLTKYTDNFSGIEEDAATGSTPNGGTQSGFTCIADAVNNATCTVTIVDRAGHTQVCTSPQNRVDSAAPEPICSLNEGKNPGYQYVTDVAGVPTLYFNSNAKASGSSFDWQVNVDEPISGIHHDAHNVLDGINYSNFSTTDSAWSEATHSATTGEFHKTYTWRSGANGKNQATATLTYGNNLSNSCSIALIADNQAPQNGGLSYTGRYIKKGDSQTIDLGLIRATDDGETDSGIDENTWEVWRYVGTLSNGVCSYGEHPTPSQIAPTQTFTNGVLSNLTATDVLSSGRCYKYELRVSDLVGNQAIFPTNFADAAEIKVDTTAPICGTAWSPAAGTDSWDVAPEVFKLYYNNGNASNASGSSDLHSGVESETGYEVCTANAVYGATCNVTISDRAGNTRICTSPINRVDNGQPIMACSISLDSGVNNALLSGTNTVYYNPAKGAGSFKLTAANVSQSVSGVRNVVFPGLADSAGQTVTPSDGSQSSFTKTYSWSASSNAHQYNQTVTMNFNSDAYLNCQVSAVADSEAPTGPELGYQTQLINKTGSDVSMSLGINKSDIIDTGVGVANWRFQYERADLGGNDTCSFVGSSTDIDNTAYVDAGAVIADAELEEGPLAIAMTTTDKSCYRFRILVTDKLGNTGVISTNKYYYVVADRPTVKITSVSQPAGVYYDNSNTIYYSKPDVSTPIIITTDASPGQDGSVSDVTYQDLTGSNVVSDANPPYTHTYTLPTGSTTSYYDRSIVAATGTEATQSAAAQFNIVYDGAGPVNVGFTTCPTSTNEYITANSFALKASYGTDALSGVNLGSSYIEGQTGTLVNGVCTYGDSYTRIADYSVTDYSVNGATDGCYRYRIVSVDNVDNITRSQACEVKVDLEDPVCGTWDPPVLTKWNSSAAGQRFALTESTDSTSGIKVAGGNCQTGTANFDTCSVQISDNAGRTKTCTSPYNLVDTSNYSLTCTLPADIANDYWYPTVVNEKPTLYFNSNSYASGTWRLYATLSETPSSGYTSPVSYPEIAQGWTSSDYQESGLTFSKDYSWTTSGATGNSTSTVDIAFGNGLHNQCSVAVLADSIAPVGTNLNYNNIYLGTNTSKVVSLGLIRGRDVDSGINEDSWKVYKSVGTLSGDSCSNYSTFTSVDDALLTYSYAGGKVSDISVDVGGDANYASGVCYRFQVEVTDMVGNTAHAVGAGEVKVDLDKPVCGHTWDPNPSPWKNAAVGQTFELLDSIDALTSMSANYYACTTEASASATCKVQIADAAGNTQTCVSPANRIDLANPVAGCYVEPQTGVSYRDNSGRFFYNPGKGEGSFRVWAQVDASSMPNSGVLYASFPALAGSNASVATQSAALMSPGNGYGNSQYYANYIWSTSTVRSDYNEPVWLTYSNYNSNSCAVSVVADTEGPDGSAPKYKDTELAIIGSRQVDLGVSPSEFSDSRSGLNLLGIQRVRGQLVDGNCANWDSWDGASAITFNYQNWKYWPSSSMQVMDDFADQSCYKYRVVAEDNVGNVSYFETQAAFRVDASKPEILIESVTGVPSSAFFFDGSNTIYYSDTNGAESIQVTARAQNSEEAISQIEFDDLDHTDSSEYTYPTPASPAYQDHTYNLSGKTGVYDNLELRAYNASDNKYSTAKLDLVYDNEGPENVAFSSCPSGYQPTYEFTVIGSYGQDALSGLHYDDANVASGSHLERAVVPQHNGVCDTASAVWTVVDNGGSPQYHEDTSNYPDNIASKQCYLYRLVAIDNVGNSTTSQTCSVKVDLDNPVCGTWTPQEVSPWNTIGGQTFVLKGSTDYTSGINVSGGECTTGDKTGDTCSVTISDKAGRISVCQSPQNKVDKQTPDLTCSLEEVSAVEYQYATKVGNMPTLYYNNGQKDDSTAISGSFRLAVDLEEPDSHIVSKDFPVLGEGWNKISGGLTSANGHYTQTYSWSEGAAGNDRAAVRFNYGNGTSGQCNIAVVPDQTSPVNGSLSYTTAYINSKSSQRISLGLTRPTDNGSGIDETSWTLWRAEANLVAGSCSDYSEYTEVSASLSTRDGKVVEISTADTMANGKCYKFQARVSDRVGNSAIINGHGEIKVDIEAPVCGTNWNPAQVAWKNEASNQTFTLSDSTDRLSGIGAASFTCSTKQAINGETCNVTIYDRAGNTAVCKSPENRIDAGVSDVACSVSASTGTAYLSNSNTIYYNPSKGEGSFHVRTTATTMPNSGIAKVAFPGLAGLASADASSSAAGNPRVYERLYTWDESTDAQDLGKKATVTYGNGNTRSCQVSAIADKTAPVAPTHLTYGDQVTSRAGSRSLNLGLNKSEVNDSGSGMSTWTIERATGVWTYIGSGSGAVSSNEYVCDYACTANEGCADYTAIETYSHDAIASDAIAANDTLVNGRCYKYRVLASDHVGNVVTIDSSKQIIVDTTVPEVSIDLISSAAENVYYDQNGVVYYGHTSGSNVTVTVTAVDGVSGSGITGTTFQNLNNDEEVTGIPGTDINTYYRVYYLNDSNTSTYFERTVSATNASSREATASYTFVYDDQAPTNAAFTTCPAGAQNTTSFSIKASYGTDPGVVAGGNTIAGSGLDLSSSYIVQQVGTLSGGVCTYPVALEASCVGADASCSQVAASGATEYAVSNATNNTCYRYLIVSADKVGNHANSTVTSSGSTCEIKIDLDDPTCGTWQPNEVNPWRTSGGQPFSLINSTDNGSGLAENLTSTCTTAGVTGSTCDVILTDMAGNSKTCHSPENKVDSATPELTCTISPLTGAVNQYLADAHTLYYSSTGHTGSFRVTTRLSEPGSGITSVQYPAISGGWTLTPAGSETATGSAGVYTKDYSWANSAESTGSGTIVYHFGNGTQSSCQISVISDLVAPTFSLGYTDAYVQNNGSVDLQLTNVADALSGVDDSSWKVERIIGTTTSGSSCDLTGAEYAPTEFTYSAGKLTATGDMADGHCYRYRVSVADNVGNVATVSSTQTIYASFEVPQCGTWTPADPVEWKGIANQQLFTLTDSDGGVSGMAQDSYSCAAPAVNDATCNVTIVNNLGVSATCTSPANRIDTSAPVLTVTDPTSSNWTATRQDLIVDAVDTLSGLARVAYSWDTNTLGENCTGGTAIAAGSNIGATIPDGERTLYVCAIDNVGNMSPVYSATYHFSSVPDFIDIDDNVNDDQLTWNVRTNSGKEDVVMEGYIPAMETAKNYTITLQIRGTTIVKTIQVSTTPGKQTGFTFNIPASEFDLSPTNYSFPGPHPVTIVDNQTGQTITKNYNINFYFPIYNSLHRTNGGGYMYPSDARLN